MALCHLGEDYVERVHHPLKIIVNEIDPQGQKLATEEDVSEVNLQ